METKCEVTIPPYGSVSKVNKEGYYIYTELIRYTGYKKDGEKIEKWQGVDCGGNINNDIVFHLHKKNISICEICENEVSCMFVSGSKDFRMKDTYQEYKRELLSDWVYNNSKKYKIEKEEIQKYSGLIQMSRRKN